MPSAAVGHQEAEVPLKHVASFCGQRLLPLGGVGAGEACDLLIFYLELKRQWKDRSLASLDSSYSAAEREQAPSPQGGDAPLLSAPTLRDNAGQFQE